MDRIFEYLTGMTGGVAYWIIFGILVACGIGFPLPEDLPLIATGYLIWDGTMQWTTGLLVTLAGVLIGDTILFYIGQRLGLTILDKKNPKLFKPEKIRRTRAYFRKYGDKLVFFARFVAGFRAVAFFMAGAMRMRYSRFILLDGLAALLSVPIWVFIGHWLGTKFGDEISSLLLHVREIKTAVTIVIGVIVLAVIIRFSLRYYRAKNNPPVTRKKPAPPAS